MILDDLFIFPIVMVDGDNEESKARAEEDMGLSSQTDPDIIIGEAECPYYDLVSIQDRWLPTSASLERALDKRFDACYVYFSNIGGFVVPWSKKRFKSEYKKFTDGRPASVKSVQFDNKEEVISFLNKLPENE